jgi:hypothetical protein
MANGSNTWGVNYSISFHEQILRNHSMVGFVSRDHDILFFVQRIDLLSNLHILCTNEYTFSLANVHRALAEFPTCNCISVGGEWNSYTFQAKEFCLEKSIGLFTPSELLGALRHEEFWQYSRKDEEGNSQYPYRVA